MATARRNSAAQIVANEGHVGEVMLFGAVDLVFDETGGPLTTAEIAATLFEQGFPAGNPRLLRDDIGRVLGKHPESFSSDSAGWSRQDPRRACSQGSARDRQQGQR